MLKLILISPVVVTFLLVLAYVKWRKEYQWRLGGILVYTIFGGMMGLIVAYVGVMTWADLYEVRYGGLAIYGFGPLFISVGELAGFWLFAWLVARNRRKGQEAT